MEIEEGKHVHEAKHKTEKEAIIVVASRGKEREKEKEKVRKRNGHMGGEGEIRKDESERVEGESNVSECMAMERL